MQIQTKASIDLGTRKLYGPIGKNFKRKKQEDICIHIRVTLPGEANTIL